jgi:hypothetical protein
MNLLTGAWNSECELIWNCWYKIKYEFSTSLSVPWFFSYDNISSTFLETPVGYHTFWLLEPPAGSWTAAE